MAAFKAKSRKAAGQGTARFQVAQENCAQISTALTFGVSQEVQTARAVADSSARERLLQPLIVAVEKFLDWVFRRSPPRPIRLPDAILWGEP